MWAKAVQLVPVILSTGATIGLFVIKIDDPKTKRLIRMIALILGIGSAFSMFQQWPTVSAAINDLFAAIDYFVQVTRPNRR
jgi:hypothetical protein